MGEGSDAVMSNRCGLSAIFATGRGQAEAEFCGGRCPVSPDWNKAYGGPGALECGALQLHDRQQRPAHLLVVALLGNAFETLTEALLETCAGPHINSAPVGGGFCGFGT